MIQSICICGAGTMGSGIAQLSAQSGFHTILFDLNENILEQAKSRIDAGLQKMVDKEKISAAEKSTFLNQLVFTNDFSECQADLIIEAIIEKMEAKTNLFESLASINSASTILATNTSSLSVNELSEKIKDPGRFIGMHFFNPAPVMKLVEIVKTEKTNAATIETAREVVKKMNKTAVVCKDAPGFIVNRVARPYYTEALRLAESGFSDFEQIDRLLEASGFKMGPFKLMDLIGNDVNYAVSCSVYEQLNKPERLKPSPLQKQKVDEGKLGKKSGEGFYKYNT